MSGGFDTYKFIVDIVTYLNSQGVGTIGSNLFAMYVPPNAPETVTVVYPSGGPKIPGSPIKTPTFAIQHRNTDPSSGLHKVTEINSMLDEAWNKLDRFTGRITVQSEPGVNIPTSSGLFLFTLNYALTGQ